MTGYGGPGERGEGGEKKTISRDEGRKWRKSLGRESEDGREKEEEERKGEEGRGGRNDS